MTPGQPRAGSKGELHVRSFRKGQWKRGKPQGPRNKEQRRKVEMHSRVKVVLFTSASFSKSQSFSCCANLSVAGTHIHIRTDTEMRFHHQLKKPL